MNISKVSYVNLYSNRVSRNSMRQHSSSKVTFRGYGEYQPNAFNNNAAYESLRGDYERDRMLHGWGYGRTEFVDYDTYVQARAGGRQYSPGSSYSPDTADVLADRHIAKGQYLSALKIKLTQAKKYSDAGRNRDAFLFEDSIRRIYPKLSYKEKQVAKTEIATYNPDMAKYIDDDVANKFVEDGKYFDALKIKLDQAREFHEKGRSRDTFLIEDSVRRLYVNLGNGEKRAAKVLISHYNSDMAEYIDEDIKNL